MLRRCWWVPALLLGLVACGTNAPATATREAELRQLATLAAPTATPVFARYTALDVIRAFNGAGLRTDNVQPVQAGKVPFNPTVSTGRTFTVGMVPPESFYVLEFATAAERDAAWDAMASNRTRLRPRFFVKDNIILVYQGANSDLVTRYETVLSGMR